MGGKSVLSTDACWYCPICEERIVLDHRSAVSDHIRTAHPEVVGHYGPGNRAVICSQPGCGKKTQNYKGLAEHYAKYHPELASRKAGKTQELEKYLEAVPTQAKAETASVDREITDRESATSTGSEELLSEAKNLSGLLTRLCDRIEKLEKMNEYLVEEADNAEQEASTMRRSVDAMIARHDNLQEALTRAQEMAGRPD